MLKNRNLFKILMGSVFAVGLLGVGTACKNNTQNSSTPDPINDYNLTLNEDAIGLDVFDEPFLLTATAEMNQNVVSDVDIIWSVVDENILTVTDGLITPKNVGTTTVKATWNEEVAECQVSITSLCLPTLQVNVESLGFIYNVSEGYPVTANFLYAGTEYPVDENSLTYSLPQGNTVANVNSDGVVTPIGVGETELTVSASFRGYVGIGTSVIIPVRVTNDGAVYIRLSEGSMDTIYLQEIVYENVTYKTESVFEAEAYIVDNTGALNKDTTATFTWYTSNDDIATISEGKVQAKKQGDVLVWAEYNNGKDTFISEKVKISVKPYLLIDKTKESILYFNINRSKAFLTAQDIFGNDFTGEIQSVLYEEKNIFEDGALNIQNLSNGRYIFSIVNTLGYAYKVSAIIYTLDETYTIDLGVKNGIYFWSTTGETFGDIVMDQEINGEFASIVANIDIDGLAITDNIIAMYYLLMSPRNELLYLLNDGYRYLEMECYADWSGTESDLVLLKTDSIGLNWRLQKGQWQTVLIDLQKVYNAYNSINEATDKNWLLGIVPVNGVNEYTFAIKQIVPYEVKDKADVIEIETAEDFHELIYDKAYTYKLKNDIVVDSDGASTFISALNSTLDLNGFTLTYNIETNAISNNKFIEEITASGVIKNGKIVVNHTSVAGYNGERGLFANIINGTIENVEFDFNSSGSVYGGYNGLFGNGKGALENVVVQASAITGGYFERSYSSLGIFNNTWGKSNLMLTNCIFIAEGHIEIKSYETWDENTVLTLENSFANTNNTNNIYVRSLMEFMESEYDTTSFTGIWNISTLTGLPFIGEENFETIEVSDYQTLAENAGKVGYTLRLQSNIIYRHDAGYGSAIPSLNATLDLNGYTLRIEIPTTDQWANGNFIGNITPVGSIQNGEIVLVHEGASNSNGNRGLIADTVNGLIKNVEILATTSGLSGSYVAVFGTGTTGILENVVIRASGTTDIYNPGHLNYFGIFNNTWGTSELMLKNCIFIAEGNVELRTYENWDTQINVTLENSFTNVNNTNNVYVRSISDYMSSNYDATSFTGVWNISTLTGLPFIGEEKFETVEVSDYQTLIANAGQVGYTIQLQKDITYRHDAGYGSAIPSLNATLDLNGYTLRIEIPTTDQWANGNFIGSIASMGSIQNGKIILLHEGALNSNGSRGLIADTVNGLIKNVEIVATTSGLSGSYVAIFGTGTTGILENVVVRVSGTVATYNPGHLSYFGIFNNTWGASELILKNCIFIAEGNIELRTYENWEGQVEVTLANSFTNANNTNNVYVQSIEAYTASNYNTESFDSSHWMIDRNTNLPSYKVNV